MRKVTTLIIGASQSGLATSKHLTNRSIDHVLIERGEVANSWQTERWDSLRLLTPNWQSRLPGYTYDGDDPDGYMSVTEVVGYLKRYAGASGAPVHAHTKVTRVRQVDGGYEVATDQGPWRCRTLVLASGACNKSSNDIVGSWGFLVNETTNADGTKINTYGVNPKGILMFDSGGHFSLFIANPDRIKFASGSRLQGTPEEYKARFDLVLR